MFCFLPGKISPYVPLGGILFRFVDDGFPFVRDPCDGMAFFGIGGSPISSKTLPAGDMIPGLLQMAVKRLFSSLLWAASSSFGSVFTSFCSPNRYLQLIYEEFVQFESRAVAVPGGSAFCFPYNSNFDRNKNGRKINSHANPINLYLILTY